MAASAAEAAAVGPQGTKRLSANGVNTFFINGKPVDSNGLGKLRNSPTCLVILLVVPFNKVPPFFYNINAFDSLFVNVIPEPSLIFLLMALF